ncbi:hypothetical protein ACFFX0_01945 [Citricoccus parietis]|uniref:Secreted protein n=1 Tax=Citricoccus parietis TaxID=592307 RepID=A0ABV5FTM5_9MICC
MWTYGSSSPCIGTLVVLLCPGDAPFASRFPGAVGPGALPPATPRHRHPRLPPGSRHGHHLVPHRPRLEVP